MPRMFPLLEYCSQLLRYDRGILLSWLPPDLPSATNQLPADLLGALVPQALVLLAKALFGAIGSSPAAGKRCHWPWEPRSHIFCLDSSLASQTLTFFRQPQKKNDLLTLFDL